MIYFDPQEDGTISFSGSERMTSGQRPFTGIYNRRVMGHYGFGDYALNKYLYTKFNGKLKLPKDLKADIKAYNNSRKKHQRKLVEGEDY